MSAARPWWGADAISLAALRQLTRGVTGSGPTTYGTLVELYSANGDFSNCPAYLAPAELPAHCTVVDANGFPLNGGYANREPDTEIVDELVVPYVYIWTEAATAIERMDSQSGFYEQRLISLCRVRRNEDSAFTPGAYGISVAREFALREALNLSRAIQYLFARDLPRTCRNLDPYGGFGVTYVLQSEPPVKTGNYGADGDTFVDAICSVTVMQLRTEPANTGV